MLKYLTIFDPRRVDESEQKARLALLLFHEFGTTCGQSLNDKLSQIGMIQGIWSMTQSVGGDHPVQENIVDLDNELLLTIQVESRFFISLCVSTEKLHSLSNVIPSKFYISHMWLCYKFFRLQYGSFKSFYEEGNNQLTAVLNEHMIPFWNDINLKPATLIRRGLDTLWYDSCKISEFDSSSNSNITDHISVDNKEESWDSMILRDVILDEESFPGIVDILVYNLPNDQSLQQPRSITKKQFGLIRNFTTDLQNVSDVSNWLYHLHTVYGTISNHILTGNMHFKERAITTENSSVDSDNDIDDINNPGNDSNHGDEHQTPPELQQTVIGNISAYSNKFVHNLTLPFSFAYDAVQEVGTTAGISNSISLFKDYLPNWSERTDDTNTHNRSNMVGRNIPRHGFLISPLANKNLPISYKVKTLNLDFTSQQDKQFNTLFWFYNDILILIVCKKSFDKIWDTSYLIELDNLLTKSIVQFHEEVIKNLIYPGSQDAFDQDFAYLIIDKNTTKNTLKSSIPPFLSKVLITNLENSTKNNSPFDLVFTGVDQLLTLGENNILSINSMGNLLGLNASKHDTETNKGDDSYNKFLMTLTDEQLWELQREIMAILEAVNKSRRNKKNIDEERLITLNNGVLCYVKEDDNKLVLIIKNWFDMKDDSIRKRPSRKTLLGSMGKDVQNWWEQNY